MRNNFESGNGHAKTSETLIADVTEAMNKTLKKQVDISVEMYNQLIGVPFLSERTTLGDDLFATKFYKSNFNLFEKNLEMYSDLTKKMTSMFTGAFFNEKEMTNYSDKNFENVTEIYERQIYKIQELNNYFFETLEKNTRGTSLDSSHMLEIFRENIKENLDASIDTFKSISKPNNKKMWVEINSQIDSMLKLNLTLWSDLILSMNKLMKDSTPETNDKARRETNEKARTEAQERTGREAQERTRREAHEKTAKETKKNHVATNHKK